MEKRLTIKSWAESDRPREKMLDKGRSVLSDAELIGILIGSGTTEETAVDLAKRMLSSVGNDLNKLGKLSIADLCKFKGIGEARAVTIAAALELGRRRKESEVQTITRITSSQDMFDVFYPLLGDLPYEEFWLLLLNRNNSIIDRVKISQGGTGQTAVDVKLCTKSALERLASSVIAVHNHPSGNKQPGREDLAVTEKLKSALGYFDIALPDHIIIADTAYYSFADNDML